ncbi:hypothetical protein SDJN02_15604, partial [Cucurbita argyrosperma subsp. argyrosperma]
MIAAQMFSTLSRAWDKSCSESIFHLNRAKFAEMELKKLTNAESLGFEISFQIRIAVLLGRVVGSFTRVSNPLYNDAIIQFFFHDIKLQKAIIRREGSQSCCDKIQTWGCLCRQRTIIITLQGSTLEAAASNKEKEVLIKHEARECNSEEQRCLGPCQATDYPLSLSATEGTMITQIKEEMEMKRS